MDHKKPQKVSLFMKYNPMIVRVGALLVFFVAVSVMYGWLVKDASVIQLRPEFAPMQFNTALCFMLLGLGLFTRTFNLRIITTILALLCFLISGASMVQYLLSVNLGIDEFFVADFIHTRTSHIGRMSPLTSICFVLYSLAFIPKKQHWALSVGITVAVILIAVASLATTPINLDGVVGWGNLQRMALHTAASFLVLGLCFLCFKLSNRSQENIDYWHAIPTMTFIVGLIITGVLWFGAHETVVERNKAYFNSLIQDSEHALHERFKLYEHALIGGLGLFYASDFVSGKEWEAYVTALKIDSTLPGINGIGYIDYVPVANLKTYLTETRGKYRADFKNYPETNFDDKFIIKYIEPYDRNHKAVGLDIGFEKNRRDAAETARDSGLPTLTHKIELVQDSQKTAGFLLLVPVYDTRDTPDTEREKREHLAGWVYAPFMGPDFFKGLDETNKQQLNFNVFDGESTATEGLIFSFHEDSDISAYTATTRVEIAGRTWTIIWQDNHHFTPPEGRNLGAIVALIGIVFSLLLYYLLNTVINSRERTAQEVKRQTKELADFATFMALIGDNMPDMMFVKDSEYRIVQANRTFFHSYPKDMHNKIIGSTTVEEYDAETAEKFLANDKLAFETGYNENEEIITFPNGEKRTLFTKKVRFENIDGEKFILGIARDITSEKIAEQKILDANDEFQRSNTELERFAYIASHDLQEPLRKISGFTSLIAEKIKDQIDEDTAQYMGFVQDGVQRMNQLIKGLLEYSRINTEKLKTVKLDANEIVALATDNISELIKDTNAKVKFKGLPSVYHDKVMLTQLFQNIISNAIKYKSDKDPIITIKAEKKDGYWEFSIKDNGMGMDEKHFSKIFEMFQRLHRREAIAGTGIGLSLCQKIVERYKGKIWVQSKVGKGSTFFFTVPTKKKMK